MASETASTASVNSESRAVSVTKSPPLLNNENEYEVWKEEIDIWCEVTDIPKSKQALLIRLSLTGRGKQAASQLTKEVLEAADGVTKLLNKLDDLFLHDKGSRQFAAFRSLYNLRRGDKCIDTFLSEFEHVYYKFTEQGMSLPDTVMAFMLLESCKLADTEVQMVMSAIKEVKYAEIKSALKRIFAKQASNNVGSDIKTEPVFHGSENEVLYSSARGNGGWRGRAGTRGGGYSGGGGYARGASGSTRGYARGGARGRGGYRGRGAPVSGSNTVALGGEGRQLNQTGRDGRKLNPVGRDGEVSRCAVCDSRYHWFRECPHSYENINNEYDDSAGTLIADAKEDDKNEDNPVHLSLFMGFTDSNDKANKLDSLVTDSEGSALIDTGCSRTVCGER